jgi:hypothetical protein
VAAALCIKNKWKPADLLLNDRVKILQQGLIKTGQYIPQVPGANKPDYMITASSSLSLDVLPFDGPWQTLTFATAQLLPLHPGTVPVFEIEINAHKATTVTISLRHSKKPANYTPEVFLGEQEISLKQGVQRIKLDFNTSLDEACYVFLCFHQNPEVEIKCSNTRITGLVTVFNKQNKAVSNYGRQQPDPGIGFDTFEFWTPERRPKGHNIGMSITPSLSCFGESNLFNGYYRPLVQPNAWVANLDDPFPELSLKWPSPKKIHKILLSFDTDFDHPMETSIWSHPERMMPFVVNDYQVFDESNQVIHDRKDNHQTRNEIYFEPPVETTELTIRFVRPAANVPVSVFGVDIN